MRSHVTHGGLAVGLAFAVSLTLVLSISPTSAHAATLDELQQKVEDSSQAYDEASQRVTDLQQQISDNQTRIDELEATLPEQREKAADSIRTLYKMQQGTPGLIELILSSDDFNDFISVIEYLDVIQSSNSDTLNELVATQEELDSTKAELAQQLTDAQTQAQAASDALDDAVAARTALEEEIAAQAAAEEAERQAAVQAAADAAAAAAATTESTDTSTDSSSSSSFTTESGNSSSVETPSDDSASTVDWQSNKDTFVSGWGARIDSYLAGSPLAGYGTTFAEAAWAYGVDPRFSPAISTVESSKGLYCFRSHNAWGWGSVSWSSWSEAIWAHTAGLASGYGGHLTYAAAKKYCPSNANFWYSTVLAEMEKI